MKLESSPTGRLEARLPNAVLTRLKRAAEIQGRTLTDFVVAAADEAACRTIEQTGIIRVSIEDQRQIAKAFKSAEAHTCLEASISAPPSIVRRINAATALPDGAAWL